VASREGNGFDNKRLHNGQNQLIELALNLGNGELTSGLD
jgi:hypothetical protein